MMNQEKSILRQSLDVLLYVGLFFFFQVLAMVGAGVVQGFTDGFDKFQSQAGSFSPMQLVLVTVVSSLLTIAVFLWARWARFDRMRTVGNRWTFLLWVSLLTLGTILPSQWLEELLELAAPESMVKLFEAILGEPSGYLAIGILAPIAEELVFRGAVLRTLLAMLKGRNPWIAIAISAVIFGAVHGNLPQMVHASLLGLVIGWLYYRTDSILPGMVFHWVNNTVAYIMFHLMPEMADGKLIDLFHGNATTMWMGIGFSLLIMVPSLLQIIIHLPKKIDNSSFGSR